MENKSKMMRQQMNETRSDLTHKLQMLEHRVVDTAGAACTVVGETVGTVKEIVHDSLQTVKESVHENVETVMDAFDLQRQVDQRPWVTLAGATALGYLGGYLLCSGNRKETTSSGLSPSATPAIIAHAAASLDGGGERREPAVSSTVHQPAAAAPFSSEASWLSRLGATFHEEISELKALAVGTLFGIVRDIAVEKAPAAVEGQMGQLIDSITVKLGGRPIVPPRRDKSMGGRQPFEPAAAQPHARNGCSRKKSPCQGAVARANGGAIE